MQFCAQAPHALQVGECRGASSFIAHLDFSQDGKLIQVPPRAAAALAAQRRSSTRAPRSACSTASPRASA